jgi:hypothetical protein
MSIQGGFQANVYESLAKGSGDADHIGITTRISPAVEPNNIPARGTGRRGLYNVLLGMIEPQLSLDMLLNDKAFLTSYQNGQNPIPFLHLKTGSIGITFTNAYVGRCAVTSRHNAGLEVSVDIWAEEGEALASQSWQSPTLSFYRWLDTVFSIDSTPETQWWEWRYEINNNLQRLGNVDDGGTREIVARHRDVTGSLVKDLRDWDEFVSMMNVAAEEDLIEILIELDGTTIINADARWGRIEGPTGAEDLIAKRFPFTLLDVS